MNFSVFQSSSEFSMNAAAMAGGVNRKNEAIILLIE